MADNVVQVVIRAKDEAKAQLQGLQQTIANLAKSAGPLSGAFDSVATSIGKIPVSAVVAAAGIAAVTAAAVAAGRALGDMAVEGAKIADETDNLAERAGTTAESFSRLTFAAGQFDASAESLSTALRFLNRNIFEARNGSAEAQATFVGLGLSVEELAKLDAGEAFLRVADSLSKVEDQSTRTGLALRTFGRGAGELVPLLSAGRAEIEATGRTLDDLGGTVSTRSGQIGDDFDKAMKRMKAAQDGLKVALSDALIPAMTSLVEAITPIVSALSAFVRESERALTGMTALANATVAVFGLDASKILAALREMGGLLIALVPQLAPLVALLNVISAFKAPTIPKIERQEAGPLFQDVRTGGQTDPDPLGLIARYEAEQKAAAEAAKAAEALGKKMAELRAEFVRVSQAAFLVPESVSRNLFQIDPAAAIVQVKAIQKELADQFAANPLVLRIDAKLTAPPDFANAASTVEIPPIDLKAGEQEAALSSLNDMLTAFGINVESLNDKLIANRTTLESFSGQVIVFGEALGAAFQVNLDPFLFALSEAQRIVGEFVTGGLDLAIRTFEDLFVKSHKGLEVVGAAVRGLVMLFKDLTVEIVKAVAQMLILSAIRSVFKIPFLSSGGQVQGPVQSKSGGQVRERVALSGGGQIASRGHDVIRYALVDGGQVRPRAFPTLHAGGEIVRRVGLHEGGQIASVYRSPVPRLKDGGQMASVRRAMVGLAAGGAILAAPMSAPVHAAAGLSVVPGSPQRHDSVPAILAPGEVVLPFINGQRPADVLTTLTQIPELIAKAVQSSMGARESQTGGPFIGQVVIQAQDADSIGNAARTGELAIQLERLAVLGR